MKSFHCHRCNKVFSLKFSLDRHIAAKHGQSITVFDCPECRQSFSRADSLKLHIKRKHLDNEPIFECAYCSKKFNQKANLGRHITSLHGNQEQREKCKCECAHCLKKFSSKQSLLRHITMLHPDKVEQNCPFKCFHCLSVFKELRRLRSHIQEVHLKPKQKVKQSRFSCLKCSNTFRTSKVLNEHYVNVHNVELNYEKLEFECIDSYTKWLENHQNETVTQFVMWYKHENTVSSTQRLICHRSRHSSLIAGSRKRRPKRGTSIRLGGICPAEIRLLIRENGTCMVQYQKTHVGHHIGDKLELSSMYLTKEVKKNIVAEIQSGIPLTEIVNRRRLLNIGENVSRVSLITRQDVRNIAKCHGLGFENCVHVEPGCDPIDVEVKIAEHVDDILFYKRQTEEDLQFNLQKDDFVLIIMTADQESYLCSHGHKVISLDGTHNTNPYGFMLHTLMVRDTECEGLPAAFLLTNRDDEHVIDIFLMCVRDRVGILKPRTLMTDMQRTYWNSWVKIMNIPQYYLFCSWHVQEAWRRNLSKIADKEKRNIVRDELYRLSSELDPIKFENDLESFLSQDDDELVNFQHYFQQNYGSNTQQWAYCFRKNAGVNTNMNLKAFHKTFKHVIARGRKIESLTQYLSFIFDYLILLKSNILEKYIRGKITNKLSILRRRHKETEEYKEKNESNVIVVDNDVQVYMVQSFETTGCFYTVSKCESKECDSENNAVVPKSCGLLCDICNLCFHAFSCSCSDSSITSNMCKHIHLVGLYLKDIQPKLDADRLRDDNGLGKDIFIGTADNNHSSLNVMEDEQYEMNNKIEVFGDRNEKMKVIEQMKGSLQEMEEYFDTSSVTRLQCVYNKIKQGVNILKLPELSHESKKKMNIRRKQLHQKRLLKVVKSKK